MPKISDEKRAQRRAQILEAAWICFQKAGLQGTTMDDIIRASGLSAGAVYSYYPSKDDLILAAVTASLSGLATLLKPLLLADPPLPPPELMRRMMGVIDRFTARQDYDLKRIALLGWSEAQRNERLRATMRAFYVEFRADLGDALRRRDGAPASRQEIVDARAAALLAVLLGFVVQSALLGDIAADDISNGLQQLGGSFGE